MRVYDVRQPDKTPESVQWCANSTYNIIVGASGIEIPCTIMLGSQQNKEVELLITAIKTAFELSGGVFDNEDG